MNTTFEKSANSTDEWYTPKEIIDALGEFDLDPCAPVAPPYKTANVMYNKNDDGLKQEWKGRVWLNPPYSRPLIECFVKRMAEHGNGIALLFNRCDSKMFQDVIFEKATAMKFLRNRIRFFRPDGTRGDSPGCGSIDFRNWLKEVHGEVFEISAGKFKESGTSISTMAVVIKK